MGPRPSPQCLERLPVRPRVGLAAVVLVSAAYAFVDLNRYHPGVYVSGLLPVVSGLALALSILGREGVTAARRYRSR